jgi:hypothetical protein
MMVTAFWGIAARLGDAHVAKAKPAPNGAFHRRAIRRPNNVRQRALAFLEGTRQPAAL